MLLVLLLQGAAPAAAECGGGAELPVLHQHVLLWPGSGGHVPVPRAQRAQGPQHLQQQARQEGSSSTRRGLCPRCACSCCRRQLQQALGCSKAAHCAGPALGVRLLAWQLVTLPVLAV